jgi:alkanesulfonate monooxygenase SsuD/methylene tetrahydromethanopterin reductase-like flavin-dependent oxidoreductase (luciferase family)
VKHGVSIPNFGPGLDATLLADWAAEAEAAGWDGFFLWDHLLAFDPGDVAVVDPWMALAVAAVRTSRLKLGTLVTPLPRRRPVKLAREVVTLDRMSGGRAVLGVGIGAMPFEWDHLGEEPDQAVRGRMLDEHLGLVQRIWSGEPVDHVGEHYRVSGRPSGSDWAGVFHPTPVRGSIPIWVAGTWPAAPPLRRAARWDGVVPMRADSRWGVEDTRAVAERMRALRGDSADWFDVVVPGESDPGDAGRVQLFAAHEAAGATWWVEGVHPWRFGWQAGRSLPETEMRARLRAGP